MFQDMSASFCIDGHTERLVQQGKASASHVTQEELLFTDIQMLQNVSEMEKP